MNNVTFVVCLLSNILVIGLKAVPIEEDNRNEVMVKQEIEMNCEFEDGEELNCEKCIGKGMVSNKLEQNYYHFKTIFNVSVSHCFSIIRFSSNFKSHWDDLAIFRLISLSLASLLIHLKIKRKVRADGNLNQIHYLCIVKYVICTY